MRLLLANVDMIDVGAQLLWAQATMTGAGKLAMLQNKKPWMRPLQNAPTATGIIRFLTCAGRYQKHLTTRGDRVGAIRKRLQNGLPQRPAKNTAADAIRWFGRAHTRH